MLVIDAGNSLIKWGWWQGAAFRRTGACDAASGLPAPEDVGVYRPIRSARVVAVSVASETVRERLAGAVLDKWGSAPQFLAPSAHYGYLRCGYADPQRLGVDRWAAMVAAFAMYDPPLLVVDCGTAVTIDYVGADGMHQGGVIIPGLRTMRRSLRAGTAQLPEVQGPPEGLLGADTAAAIRNGTFHAVVGAIDHIAAALAEASDGEGVHRLLTGGDGSAIAGHLATPYVLDKDLVLRGAALLADAA